MLNETNITINISKVIIESQSSEGSDYLVYWIPIIAVIVTGIVTGAIAILNIKANSRNILIQMNQPEIMKNIKTLTEKIHSGNTKDISKFLDSENGIYIPSSLRKKIQKILDSEKNVILSEENEKSMLKVVNEYITDFKVFAHNIF